VSAGASPHLLEVLLAERLIDDREPAVSCIRRIRTVVLEAEGDEGDALRLMTGLEPETSNPRTQRTEIKEEMATVLANRGVALSARRVEQLEVKLLAPLVAVGLGLSELLPECVKGHLPLHAASGDESGRAHDSSIRDLPVFAQYCNPELFRLSGLGALLEDADAMSSLLRSATRLALLITDDLVLFPASYLFEVPGFSTFLTEAGPARELGCLGFVSPTPDLEAFADLKAGEYRLDQDNPYVGDTASVVRASSGLVWRPRLGRATAESIRQDWNSSVRAPGASLSYLAKQVSARTGSNQLRVLAALEKVPERLDGAAFVGRFARRVLDITLTPLEVVSIDVFLSNSYLRSYVNSLNAVILVDFPFADLSCGLMETRSGRHKVVSIRPLILGLNRLNLADFVLDQASWEEFLEIRCLPVLSLAMDALALHSGSADTESALARLRHPAQRASSPGDVGRLLDSFSRLLTESPRS
jgi:hypothetical protein